MTLILTSIIAIALDQLFDGVEKIFGDRAAFNINDDIHLMGHTNDVFVSILQRLFEVFPTPLTLEL